MGGANQNLQALGWGEHFASVFADADDGTAWPGRVSRVDRGGWLTVETAHATQRARQHRRFRRLADPTMAPTVGDWVVLRDDPGGGPALAESVLPRRSAFIRNAGDDERAQPQVLAANIDTVFIVVAADVEYNARRTDRLLSLAWASGAEPVIVLTKADVCPDLDALLHEVAEHVVGAQVLALSSRSGQGLEAFERHLQTGRTFVLIGQSGAGKSTLANRLAGEEVLDAKAVRSDGKGRHTTTHRQLLRLPAGALLIDTPGLRSVGLWEERLDEGAFADIDDLAASCRFADCAHEQEPGCAVRAAIAAGELTPQRWDSYRTLREEGERIARARELSARAQRGGRRRR